MGDAADVRRVLKMCVGCCSGEEGAEKVWEMLQRWGGMVEF